MYLFNGIIEVSSIQNGVGAVNTPRRLYQKEGQFQMDTSNNIIAIPLSKGYTAIVDQIDADLAKFKWHVRTQSYYAARGVGPRNDHHKIYMHRAILERMLGRSLSDGETVDHINGDVRDNRRSNLRLATHQQNSRNQRRNKANKTGVKGVSYDRNCPLKPYRTYITVDNRQIHLGHYPTIEEARDARKLAADRLFGEFNRANQYE